MREIEIQCPSCGGYGVYQGMSERDTCAVECHSCKGTGKTIYRYEEFTGRKIKADITRIFGNSCGYVHSANDVTTDEGKLIQFSKGGCSYEEWLNGEIPKPVKDLYCPYIWNNKGYGNEPLEDCKIYLEGFGSISKCKNYDNKLECWAKLE